MVKKIIIYAVILAQGFVISCSDVLDMGPDGQLNNFEDIFKDPNMVGSYLGECYRYVPAKGAQYFYESMTPVVLTDEAWDADSPQPYGNTADLFYRGLATSSNALIYWGSYWQAIRKCTVFLENIDQATVETETERRRWKAEAHVLRAFYYLELLMWHGGYGLPIMDESFSFDQDFASVTRSTPYEVAKFILNDCEAALATADLPWRITSSAEGQRVTKAVAAAVMSRAMLFAASPLYNDGANHWDETFEVTERALNLLLANGYELYKGVAINNTYMTDRSFLGPDNVNDVHTAQFNEYFTNAADYSNTPRDKETIWQHWTSNFGRWFYNGIGPRGGYKTGATPTQEAVDAFDTRNGEPVLDLKTPYSDERHMTPNYNPTNSLYDPENPYENRDPRFYAFIYYNGSMKWGWWVGINPDGQTGIHTVETHTTGIAGIRSLSERNRAYTPTGYYMRKFVSPVSGRYTDNEQTPPAKLFRLAEAYLNVAEAAAEAGRINEAHAAINAVRERAGMPQLPSGISGEDLILRIKNERRVELMFEENRYFDVRRWQPKSGNLEKTDKWVSGMYITKLADGSHTYQRFNIGGLIEVNSRPVIDQGQAVARANYTNRYLFQPIPRDEASRMEIITGENWQLPGW